MTAECWLLDILENSTQVRAAKSGTGRSEALVDRTVRCKIEAIEMA